MPRREERAEGARLRSAGAADAAAIAGLHAESWRRHYRGAYSDAFLDGDVHADRLAVWAALLDAPDPARQTILAEVDGHPVGFASFVLDEDPTWGSLLENLHVATGHRRQGIGSRLLARTAASVSAGGRRSRLYLWVLEQNVQAQAFYRARGGRCTGRAPVSAPGGIAARLRGDPLKLRYAWPRPAVLLQRP